MIYRFEGKDDHGNKRYILVDDVGGRVVLSSKSGMCHALSNTFDDVIRLEFEIEKACNAAADHSSRVSAMRDVLNNAGPINWEVMT